MLQPGRSYSAGDGYRYGFNGQEKSNEIRQNGNSYSADSWEFDPRLGKRWNCDPVPKAYESPYCTFGNNPINFIDPDGSDTLRILGGKNNSKIDIIYGQGTATHTFDFNDKWWLPNTDIGNHTYNLTGLESPDLIGLDLGGSINIKWLGGQIGINLVWKTRGEKNSWTPEVFFYNASGGFFDGKGKKDLNLSFTATVVFGYANIYDPTTGKDQKYVGAKGDEWVANGMNYTGRFWNVTGAISFKAVDLIGSRFWGYDPSKPKPAGPYWSGFEIGIGKSIGKKTTSVGSNNNILKALTSLSGNVQRQYFYLLYGNGGDHLKNGEDVSGLNIWNPKDPEDDK